MPLPCYSRSAIPTLLRNCTTAATSTRFLLRRAFRDKTPLSIRLVNIDHFKMINDTFGHPFGNVCLASAAGAVPDASDSPASLLKAADLLLCRAKKKGRNRIESSIE